MLNQLDGVALPEGGALTITGEIKDKTIEGILGKGDEELAQLALEVLMHDLTLPK